MAHIHRKIIACAAMALFLAGCTEDALGPEYRELSEEESGLQFYAPGLQGGYRNFIFGQDAKFVGRLVAVYGPKRGEYPHGRIMLVEMPPGRHFTRVNPAKDSIERWGSFKDRTITHGPAGTAVNVIGRIDYAAFQADGVACVVFRQPFGTVHDTGRGTRLLDGYYCKGAAPMMTGADVETIVKLIGHRKYGAISRPPGWPSATEGAVSSQAYARSGVASARAGDYNQAIDDFTEAIRLDPRNATYYRNRGHAYRDKGNSDRAIQDYSEAIRLDPTYTSAYSSRGIAYKKKGDYDLAIRDYDEVIRLDPSYAAAYNNRCWVYGLTRRPDEALRDCNESLRLRPDNPATLDSRALVHWLLGDHDKSRRDLERAREINPRLSPWQDRFREFEGMF